MQKENKKEGNGFIVKVDGLPQSPMHFTMKLHLEL